MKSLIIPMIKFFIVGGTGTLVNLGVLYLLTEFLNFWYIMSAIIAIVVSTTINFFGNKLWTFRSEVSKTSPLFLQYRNFWLVTLIGVIAQLALIYVMVEYFGIWYLLSAFLGIVLASFGKFLLNKFWVFRKA